MRLRFCFPNKDSGVKILDSEVNSQVTGCTCYWVCVDFDEVRQEKLSLGMKTNIDSHDFLALSKDANKLQN